MVVVPTYNEKDNLDLLLERIFELQPGFCVLIVDDASPDGTGAMADAWAQRDARVAVLHRDCKEGLGPAYMAGFRRALGDTKRFTHIFEMDADLSHDPRHLGALLEACQPGCGDFVAGSRYLPGGDTPGWPWLRRLISRVGGAYARLMLGVKWSDPTAGFVCFRREVLEGVDLAGLQSRGYGFQIELKWRCAQAGFVLAESPIVFRDRTLGDSKMRMSIVSEALGVVWRLRRDARRRAIQAPSPRK